MGGSHRGIRKLLRESLAVVSDEGYDSLLTKYPCPTVGNPSVFNYQGFRFTYTWLKHIYVLGLMQKVLKDRLGDDFIAMDIGSSFGCLTALLKMEHPGSHHLLVDFYEQLVLAYYFLGMLFSEPRIAGVKDLSGLNQITADIIQEYDFVLIPCGLFSRISPETADVVVNVSSLGEMSRKWFDFYLQSSPFQTAKYFVSYNRMQAYPTYESGITVLDYPILDPEKRLHFAVTPFRSYRYARRLLFFLRNGPFLPVFEYIGEI